MDISSKRMTGFDFSETLLNFQDCYLEDGYITEKIVHGKAFEKIKPYNPFDYYTNKIPNNIVGDILGKSISTEMHLHTLYASLDSNDELQIIRWTNYFGFLSLPDMKHDKDTSYSYYSLNKFKTELNKFKRLLSIYEHRDNSSELLQEILLDTAKCYYGGHLPGPLNTEGTSSTFRSMLDSDLGKVWSMPSLAYGYIQHCIGEKLDNISPMLHITNDDTHRFALSWSFNKTLISAIYFMVALDITGDQCPRLCKNARCGNYYKPSRTRQIYCDEACKERAKQHRIYSKKKALLQGSDEKI